MVAARPARHGLGEVGRLGRVAPRLAAPARTARRTARGGARSVTVVRVAVEHVGEARHHAEASANASATIASYAGRRAVGPGSSVDLLGRAGVRRRGGVDRHDHRRRHQRVRHLPLADQRPRAARPRRAAGRRAAPRQRPAREPGGGAHRPAERDGRARPPDRRAQPPARRHRAAAARAGRRRAPSTGRARPRRRRLQVGEQPFRPRRRRRGAGRPGGRAALGAAPRRRARPGRRRGVRRAPAEDRARRRRGHRRPRPAVGLPGRLGTGARRPEADGERGSGRHHGDAGRRPGLAPGRRPAVHRQARGQGPGRGPGPEAGTAPHHPHDRSSPAAPDLRTSAPAPTPRRRPGPTGRW